MIKKGFSLAVIIAVVMIGFMQKDVWLSMIRAGGMYAVLMSILLVAADVFFPIVPFAIIAALNGAVFGIVNGVWITLSGAMLGTMALFFLVRYGFRDWARKKLLAYPAAAQYEDSFHQHAFTAVLFGRLIPIIPSLAMNTVCGLSNIRWPILFFCVGARQNSEHCDRDGRRRFIYKQQTAVFRDLWNVYARLNGGHL